MEALYNGFKKVWKAKGAAGIDGQNLNCYASNLSRNLEQLLLELQEKRYQPLPVRRVEIDKDDGGKRLLGIPAVRDRIVQQVLLDILTPIFDPDFPSVQLRIQAEAKLSSSHHQGDIVHTQI